MQLSRLQSRHEASSHVLLLEVRELLPVTKITNDFRRVESSKDTGLNPKPHGSTHEGCMFRQKMSLGGNLKASGLFPRVSSAVIPTIAMFEPFPSMMS